MTRDVTVLNYFKVFRILKAQVNCEELQISKTKWMLKQHAKLDVEI